MNVDDVMAEIAAAGRVLAAAGLPRVAEALMFWYSGASLESALGLPSGWREALRRERRDEALRRLAATVPAPSERARAACIALALRRYAASTFPHDRRVGRRPDGDRGLLHDVLVCGPAPAAPTIRAVLSRRNG